MNRHTTSGQWGLGLMLALTTTIIWGILPIVLKILVAHLDVYTLTWYRFIVASLLAGILVIRRYKIQALIKLNGSYWLIFVIAVLGISVSYIVYPLGLAYISPSTAQVVTQISIIFMLGGGLLFYRERLSGFQWIGLVILILGIGLFFNQQYTEFYSASSALFIGSLLVVTSGAALAVYTLAQKQLLQVLSPEAIMCLVYLAGAILCLPLSEPSKILSLSTSMFMFLTFSAMMTLVGFFSLANALRHLEVNRVSMILAIVPLVTVIAMRIGTPLLPDVLDPERLNVITHVTHVSRKYSIFE